jgi:hypothetical protein
MSIERPPIERSRAVNHGDRTPLRPGAARQQLAWVSVPDSQPWVVYAQAKVKQPPAGGNFPTVVPFVELEWGHGGASVFATFPVIPGNAGQPGNVLRVPLAASMVKASGLLLDEGGSVLSPQTPASAQIACVIAPGFDGIPQVPTEWISFSGAAGIVANRPSKLTHLLAYQLTGTGRLWLMLIDSATAPDPGATPIIAAPLGGFPALIDLSFPNGVPFTQGVWLAVSTDPDVLSATPPATVSARLERQLL